ncbi:MAG: NAD-dependent epimerase/dehydratase family protein [Alphaproteobacteria bacterium]|nr:NAD-dependent epimerase/dehydratase family protein [Alphaproteobacteria bacterium]
MTLLHHPIVAEDLDRIVADDLPWHDLDGAVVAVTGAYGTLATYLVGALLRARDVHGVRLEVVAVVRSAAKARERFGTPDGLSVVVSDLSTPPALPPGVTHVVHAASPATPAVYDTDPVGTLLPNVLGTWHLLEHARVHGVRRFLFVSSGEVYGVVPPERIPIPEDGYGVVDPATVRACYGEGKRVAETMCVAWHHQHGVPAVIVRPFHTYGPGLSLDDGRVFADFVANVVRGEDIVLKSAGTAMRPFCYLSDATRGFLRVLLQGEPGTAYNVGHEEALISIAALADRVVALFPERGLRVVRGAHREGYLQSPIPTNAPDTTRLRALGWAPEVGIDEGFARTIRSYA